MYVLSVVGLNTSSSILMSTNVHSSATHVYMFFHIQTCIHICSFSVQTRFDLCSHHLDDIPEEVVTRYMYNPRSVKWKTDKVVVKMQAEV